ncbi:hypothetical protein [Nitrospirillum iridis]|uniref:ElaB/YqjD/DUF883 family membrane-anchored ribosome-binding protein n=1 Tax=Nitrospirillum iridis TaxID=765888 RepID=A0A7X0B2M3_9PROT|nr:hypothetical protein [Nitrospirillum iridis]MBB6254603.1 ElaB/YqjD/DUF883 family membrane-anchored ribosome-binding protein [Nitrospirillum iridis]
MKSETIDAAATAARSVRDAAREDADTLTSHLKAEANDIYKNLAAKGEEAAKALGTQVEAQPITSLLLAFSAGFIVSRLLSR